jgi:glycosyltransferase involved in cell wall biosynthesis
VSENSTTAYPPQVSVIVPAFNAEGTIDRCLQALTHQTVPRDAYELIVVDDGSSDLTRTRVGAHDSVKLYTQANAGPAAARNMGAQHAQGEILLFTDADCAPAEDWIEQMAAAFSNGNVAGVKGVYLTHQKEPVARFVQMEYEDKYDHMAREEYIDFIDTYAAGYRRDVFMASGGFDTSFPEASVEDQELSFRLARQGHKMIFVPEARVYHWGHARNLWIYFRRKFGIGFWKVLVHKRHPNKLMRDSHTPQSLKVQILLVGLGGLLLCGGVVWPFLWWGLAITALLFLLTTLPFVFKAWAKDPVLAIISPALLFVRALALGMGLAAGLLLNPGTKKRAGDRRNG